MKKTILVLIAFYFSLCGFSQEQPISCEKAMRVNFMNPGIECELPISKSSTLSFNVGIGYGGSYKDLSFNGDGFMYLISPFYDLQYRHFCNLDKRVGKQKSTNNNSGNFGD